MDTFKEEESEDLPIIITAVATQAALERKTAILRLCQNLNIPTELLDVDPANWESIDDNKAAVRRVNDIGQ